MALGPLMIDLESYELSQEESELLTHPLVGGVIFFKRNFHSREQISALSQQVYQAAQRPLLLAVDQEGGQVQRFREGFITLPANGEVTEWVNKTFDDPEVQAQEVFCELGWLMAKEVLSVGVDLSFAPVLDIDSGKSQVIGKRAFAAEPEQINLFSDAYIDGMHQAGMRATGKHFPGHGSVVADSHLELPSDERDWQDITQLDLIPFEHAIDNGIDALMMAHIVFPKVDERPAGFSSIWLQSILKQQLNFSGVIFSDDLSMNGATCMGSMSERAQASLDAGCHMALICNNRLGVIDTLDNLNYTVTEASSSKLEALKAQALWNNDYLTSERYESIKHVVAEILNKN